MTQCTRFVESTNNASQQWIGVNNKSREDKSYKEPSVPIRGRRTNAVTASGDLDQFKSVTIHSDPSKLCALSEMDRFKGKGGQ